MLPPELWGRIMDYLVGGTPGTGSAVLVDRMSMLDEMRQSQRFCSRKDPMTLTAAVIRFRKHYPLWMMKTELTIKNNRGVVRATSKHGRIYMFYFDRITYVSVHQ